MEAKGNQVDKQGKKLEAVGQNGFALFCSFSALKNESWQNVLDRLRWNGLNL